MENEKKVLISFNIIQVTYYWGFAGLPAFVGALLISKGMSNTQLSLLLAVYMLAAFVGQFFWGMVCDKLQTNKKIFILGNILVAILDVFIYIASDNFALVSVLYVMLGFIMVPLPSNLDAWMLRCFAHRQEVYGPARGWASLGYAVFMLIYGAVIASVGYVVMPFVAVTMIAITVLVSLTIPDSPPAEKKSGGFKIKDIGKLIKIKPYIYIVIILLGIGLTIAPMNNMKIVVLQSVGGTVAHQGYDSAIMCFFQLPFFFLAGKIRRIPQRIRLVMAALLTMSMVVIDFFAVSPYMIIAGSVCNAISFSILLPTTREITEKNVDIHLRTTAHGITDAVYSSLAGTISLLYMGAVIDNCGIKTMFIICMCIQAVPVIMTIAKLLSGIKNRQTENGGV